MNLWNKIAANLGGLVGAQVGQGLHDSSGFATTDDAFDDSVKKTRRQLKGGMSVSSNPTASGTDAASKMASSTLISNLKNDIMDKVAAKLSIPANANKIEKVVMSKKPSIGQTRSAPVGVKVPSNVSDIKKVEVAKKPLLGQPRSAPVGVKVPDNVNDIEKYVSHIHPKIGSINDDVALRVAEKLDNLSK